MDVHQLTRNYFAALEQGMTGDKLAALYHPEVIQEEFPNRLQPAGARRDLAGILVAASRGARACPADGFQLLARLLR